MNGRKTTTIESYCIFPAKWRNQVDVAVKTLHTGQVPTEAILMHKLRHRKLVQLLGVCTVSQTIFIITELMVNGSLLEYLRTAEGRKIQLKDMIDMAAQVKKFVRIMQYR